MKKFDAWWFPDHEKHLQKWMTDVNRRVDGRLTYQYGKYADALAWCRARRVAIDIGAHVGLWSYFMAQDFKNLVAFEPCALHRECWYKNLVDFRKDEKANALVFECALGAAPGHVAIETRTPGSSGDTGVAGDGDIEMRTLDSFRFDVVDFIKIDCEGYEAHVLHGAVETLKRCKPCVIVEQKRDMAEKYGLEKMEAVKFLQGLGAKLRAETSGDYILSWD